MTKNKDNCINYFTYGKSLACVLMATRLPEIDETTRKKITTHLGNYNKTLNQLSLLTDHSIKMALAKQTVLYFTNHCLLLNNLDDFNVDTTMKNIIKYRYRLWLDKHGGYSKKELEARMKKNKKDELNVLKFLAGK